MTAGRKRLACVRNYANIFELVERNICIFDTFVVFFDNVDSKTKCEKIIVKIL